MPCLVLPGLDLSSGFYPPPLAPPCPYPDILILKGFPALGGREGGGGGRERRSGGGGGRGRREGGNSSFQLIFIPSSWSNKTLSHTPHSSCSNLGNRLLCCSFSCISRRRASNTFVCVCVFCACVCVCVCISGCVIVYKKHDL